MIVWLMLAVVLPPVLLIAGVFALRRTRQLPKYTPGHLCRGCNYDLTGNVSGRCPECGRQVSYGPGPRLIGNTLLHALVVGILIVSALGLLVSVPSFNELVERYQDHWYATAPPDDILALFDDPGEITRWRVHELLKDRYRRGDLSPRDIQKWVTNLFAMINNPETDKVDRHCAIVDLAEIDFDVVLTPHQRELLDEASLLYMSEMDAGTFHCNANSLVAWIITRLRGGGFDADKQQRLSTLLHNDLRREFRWRVWTRSITRLLSELALRQVRDGKENPMLEAAFDDLLAIEQIRAIPGQYQPQDTYLEICFRNSDAFDGFRFGHNYSHPRTPYTIDATTIISVRTRARILKFTNFSGDHTRSGCRGTHTLLLEVPRGELESFEIEYGARVDFGPDDGTVTITRTVALKLDDVWDHELEARRRALEPGQLCEVPGMESVLATRVVPEQRYNIFESAPGRHGIFVFLSPPYLDQQPAELAHRLHVFGLCGKAAQPPRMGGNHELHPLVETFSGQTGRGPGPRDYFFEFEAPVPETLVVELRPDEQVARDRKDSCIWSGTFRTEMKVDTSVADSPRWRK